MIHYTKLRLRRIVSWSCAIAMCLAGYAVVNGLRPDIAMPIMILLAFVVVLLSASET